MKLRIAKKDRVHHRETLAKATPMLVHLMMIGSVGLYAVFGAVVMRKLETRSMSEIRSDVEARHAERELLVEKHDAESPLPLRHRRRREREDEGALTRALKQNSTLQRERRAAAEVMRSRKCVINVIKEMGGECGPGELDSRLIKALDKCYHVAVEHSAHTKDVIFKNSAEQVETGNETQSEVENVIWIDVEEVAEEHEEIQPWSFMDSLLFAFTVITTIGYGNVAPKTFWGRLFVILYGLIGIPFTLLAIADMGKFLSEIMYGAAKHIKQWKKRAMRAIQSKTPFSGSQYDFNKLNGTGKSSITPMSEKTTSLEDIVKVEQGDAGDEKDTASVTSEDDLDDGQALPLFILFIVYIAFGGFLLCSYEPDMDFFKAVYFNFVTLTSIGLGDIVPRSETFMAVTIVYIAIGLALTTIAIEIAADTLKKLHYFGRKIENVANVPIWFGGKKLTMKQLVRNLGDQFNLPTTVIKDLDLDTFVDNAIKVEAGEIETLRPPPYEPDDDVDADYADGTEDELDVWKCDPTPEPSPTPSPEPPPQPPREPTPEPPKEPTPEPTPTPPRTPTPEPTKEPTPEPSPPPRTPTPEPEPPREPTPEPVREPTPEPPREPTPEPPREPTPEPEPEPEPEEEQVLLSERKQPKKRQLTAAELAAQKRKAYSEDAWKRYQEYQNQWKKFRQTKNPPRSTSKPPTSSSSKSSNPMSTSSSRPGSSASSRPSRRQSGANTPESTHTSSSRLS